MSAKLLTRRQALIRLNEAIVANGEATKVAKLLAGDTEPGWCKRLEPQISRMRLGGSLKINEALLALAGLTAYTGYGCTDYPFQVREGGPAVLHWPRQKAKYSNAKS